jgi:hypothetical protein
MLIASPALRADLGRRARDRAGMYSHQQMAAGYLAVYRHMIGRAHYERATIAESA